MIRQLLAREFSFSANQTQEILTTVKVNKTKTTKQQILLKIGK